MIADGLHVVLPAEGSAHERAQDRDSARETAVAEAMPLHIVIVITRLNVGGPAQHVITLARDLARRGHRPLLVYGARDASEAGLEDRIEGVPSLSLPSLRRRVSPWQDLRSLVQLTRLLLRERPHVVHTHTAKAGALGRAAAAIYNSTRPRRARCAVVHTFHGHVFRGYFGAAGSATVRVIERTLARMTDRILAVSPGQRAEICDEHRIVSAGTVAVICPGVDVDGIQCGRRGATLRQTLGFREDDVVFGFVGRFAAIKNLPLLVRAFAAAAARSRGMRLVLAGGGDQEAAIRRLVADLGIGHLVRMPGWQHDVASLWHAIDVGVLASRNEGTPFALMEAMAAGRPVVATAVGGVTDIVDHDRTGLLVPGGDVEALAAAMARLALDSALRDRLGTAAQRVALARFDSRHAADELIGVYTDITRPGYRRIIRKYPDATKTPLASHSV